MKNKIKLRYVYNHIFKTNIQGKNTPNKQKMEKKQQLNIFKWHVSLKNTYLLAVFIIVVNK